VTEILSISLNANEAALVPMGDSEKEAFKSHRCIPGWAHELKHDGYRLQIHVRDGRVRLYTINGADWSKRYSTTSRA
jgi:ATP-dependent DNA ligase